VITHRTRNESNLAPVKVRIPCGLLTLEGVLAVPKGAAGIVVFAHGSGSSRHSPRNKFVALVIRESGYGTLLFDLLSAEEEIEDDITWNLRFDIALLASRLAVVTQWLDAQTVFLAAEAAAAFRVRYFVIHPGP
jgi:putative phosphoribosyl transferase